MEFCPECGGMMLPHEEEIVIEEDNKEENIEAVEVKDDEDKSEDGKDNGDDESAKAEEEEPEKIVKKYLKCHSCGFKKDLSEEAKEKYSVEKEIKSADTVIMRGDESGMKSTVREICPKCGHDRASYELLQTRSADEAPTRFFTCEKCGYKWRGYD